MTFEYAPAPESTSIVDIRPSYGLFIDGEFRDSIDGDTIKTINPATEEVLSEVVAAGPRDVAAAVEAARRAYQQHSTLQHLHTPFSRFAPTVSSCVCPSHHHHHCSNSISPLPDSYPYITSL